MVGTCDGIDRKFPLNASPEPRMRHLHHFPCPLRVTSAQTKFEVISTFHTPFPQTVPLSHGRVRMAIMALQLVAVIGAILGLASHLGFFIHGEHHMQTTKITAFFIIAPFVLFAITVRESSGRSYLEASKITAVGTVSYFTALSTSILVYRAFFHPLRNFPGPFSAKLSKITHVFKIAKDSKNYLLNEVMFEKYGEFVRFEGRCRLQR
jgi:hypothetical protein